MRYSLQSNTLDTNTTEYAERIYQSHSAASVIVFTMMVTLGIAALYCSKNYITYLLMCRTDAQANKLGEGEWSPPKAVRLRDSGCPGTILKSSDSGISWVEIKLPTTAVIVSAKAPSPEEMYLLDCEGKVFKSVNFGEDWFQDTFLNENNFGEI